MRRTSAFLATAAVLILCIWPSLAQAPPGLNGIPNLTPAQSGELARIDQDLTALVESTTKARTALATAVFAESRNDSAIRTAVRQMCDAELALASARAKAVARVQASPNR